MRHLVAILAALFATALNAAEVKVRSGEHIDFTRVVLDFSEATSYTAEESQKTLSVSPSVSVSSLDTSRLFEKIDQKRVSSVSLDGRKISVNFACECEATHFAFDNSIVIDIRSGTKKTNLPVIFSEPGPSIEFETNDKPTLEKSSDSDSDFRRQLTDQLSRAANQGLISLQPTLKIQSPEPDTSFERRDQEAKPPANVITSVDSAYSGVKNGHDLLSGCEKTSFWWEQKYANDFNEALSKSRADYSSSNGTETQEARLDLARTYLAFGLGLEALNLLEIDPELEEPNLKILAHFLMKKEGAESSRQLDGCDPLSLLVIRMRDQDFELTGRQDWDQWVKLLSRLPSQLAKSLAPEFVSLAKQAGQLEVANIALGVLEKTTLTDPSSKTLSEEEIIDKLIANGGTKAGIALAKKIESKLARGEEISEGDEVTLAAYLIELRGTSAESRLRNVRQKLDLRSGELHPFLKDLEAGDVAFADFEASFLEGLLKQSTEAFLRAFASSFARYESQNLSPRVREEISNRLVENLQFESAKQWLSGLQKDEETNLLRAKIELKQGNFRQVISLLEGSSLAIAKELTARAESALMLKNSEPIQLPVLSFVEEENGIETAQALMQDSAELRMRTEELLATKP